MKKLLSIILFSLLSSQVYAVIDYDMLLQPEQTETFSNQLWWSISGNCTVETTENLITLDFTIQGDASVNGRKITPGEHMKITAYNGQRFQLNVDSGATIEITKVKNSEQEENTKTAIAHCHM